MFTTIIHAIGYIMFVSACYGCVIHAIRFAERHDAKQFFERELAEWDKEDLEQEAIEFLQSGATHFRYPSVTKTIEEAKLAIREDLEDKIRASHKTAEDMHQKMIEAEDKAQELTQAFHALDVSQQVEGLEISKQRNILQQDARLLDHMADTLAQSLRDFSHASSRSVPELVRYMSTRMPPSHIHRIRNNKRFKEIAEITNLRHYYDSAGHRNDGSQ